MLAHSGGGLSGPPSFFRFLVVVALLAHVIAKSLAVLLALAAYWLGTVVPK